MMPRISGRLVKVSVSAMTIGLCVLGLHSEPAAPSWYEFRASTYKDAEGRFIVNGDEPINDDLELREYFDRMLSGTASPPSPAALVANRGSLGTMTLWGKIEAKNLSYCISDSFRELKPLIIQSMAKAAAIWERASSALDFHYSPDQDHTCNVRNGKIVFSVEPTRASAYLARAFFPDSPKSDRNILVSRSIETSGQAPQDILAHELGHVLGFRHEHTRPEAATCFEDNEWLPLTAYDSSSIMHYPQCNGSSVLLRFSQLDARGVRIAYGP